MDVRCWRRRADAVGAIRLAVSRESTECQVVRALQPRKLLCKSLRHTRLQQTRNSSKSICAEPPRYPQVSEQARAVKMYNDNMVALRRRVEDQNFSFSPPRTQQLGTELALSANTRSHIFLQQSTCDKSGPRARLTHSEAAYGFDALLETQTQEQSTMELPTMRSTFVWVPTTVWRHQPGTSKSHGTRVVNRTQSTSLENAQRERSSGVVGFGNSISGEGGRQQQLWGQARITIGTESRW